jgi:hypothetical protein
MLRKLNEGQRRTVAHWAMEFLIVVVGVLLALWLQELATSANKRSDARAAEASIRNELDGNLLILVLQDVVADCRRERLGEIEHHLANDEPAAPIVGNWGITATHSPKHQAVYGFFNVDVTDTAWRSAIANGSASAMQPDRFRSIADLYANFDAVRQALATDEDAANSLEVLSYGVPLTPELRGSLIKAYYIAHANLGLLTQGISAQAIAQQMRGLGWNDENHMDMLISGAKQQMQGFGFRLKACAKPFVNPFAANQRAPKKL